MNITLAEYVVALPPELDINNVNRVEIRGVEFVPVVRCEYCKHYLDEGCGNVDSQSPSKNLMGVKPDWFCADGERRK